MVFQRAQDFFIITRGCSYRFFVTAGIIASAEATSLVGGSGSVLPLKSFKFGGSEMLFSALVIICLRKIDLEDENGRQLQITIIKITESKENKSIHRLDLSGSTGPGAGGSCPTALLLVG